MIRDLLNRLFRPARLVELVATEDGGFEIKRPWTLRDVIEDQEQSHFKESISLRVDTPEWTVLVDQLSTEIYDNPSFSEEELVAKLISASLRIADDFIAPPVCVEFNGTNFEIYLHAYAVSKNMQVMAGQPIFGTFADEHRPRLIEVMQQIASASLASLLIADLIGTQQPCPSLPICRLPLEVEIKYLHPDDWRKFDFFDATYYRYGYQNADEMIDAMMKEGVIPFFFRKWLEELPECERFTQARIAKNKADALASIAAARIGTRLDDDPRRPAM